MQIDLKRAAIRLALLAMLGLASPAVAQAGDWQYELTPYLFAAGMKGDVQSGTLPKVTTDVSFSDILDVLDFGAMGRSKRGRGAGDSSPM